LEGQSDHSGVTVALYALAALDTMVQRMNREFPMVGIPISQATEFDHRLAEPVYQTQTMADGSYKLEGVTEGSYNLVAVKPGFGWKYLYEIEVAKGAKTTNAENIVLYPEMEVSGELSQYTVWPSEHHIIVKGDVSVPEGETLIIDKGAVIRFDGFYEIEVQGSLQANGQEDQMVVFTSNRNQTNAGDWKTIKVKGPSSELRLQAAKVEFANTGVDGVGSRIDVIKSTIRQMSYTGLLAGNECEANIIENFFSHCAIGVRVESNSKALAQHNLIYESKKNDSGMGVSVNGSEATFTSNIIIKSDMGVNIEYATGTLLQNNYITDCEVGVSLHAANPNILMNTFTNCSEAIVSFNNKSMPVITVNNLLSGDNQKAILATGIAESDINARNNYWATKDTETANRKIFDQRTDAWGKRTAFQINITPITLAPYDDAKPM
jgi:hypothetical protein